MWPSDVVELLYRYSNRRDLLEPLVEVVRRIRENDQTDEPGLDEPVRVSGPAEPSFAGRLGAAGIEAVVGASSAGQSTAELAAEYGVSLSTMQRLLRKYSRQVSP